MNIKMNTMKTMSFEKRDKKWSNYIFYQIYIDVNNIKKIKFIGSTDREPLNKPYLSWVCKYYDEFCEISLEEFLLWDVYYQLDLLEKKYENKIIEVEPWECYEQANKWVLGDGNGSYYKLLVDLTENIPCGYYYGY